MPMAAACSYYSSLFGQFREDTSYYLFRGQEGIPSNFESQYIKSMIPSTTLNLASIIVALLPYHLKYHLKNIETNYHEYTMNSQSRGFNEDL